MISENIMVNKIENFGKNNEQYVRKDFTRSNFLNFIFYRQERGKFNNF